MWVVQDFLDLAVDFSRIHDADFKGKEGKAARNPEEKPNNQATLPRYTAKSLRTSLKAVDKAALLSSLSIQQTLP